MSALRSMDSVLPLPRLALLSFLPMAHAGGRNNAHHYALVHGATITACPDFADVSVALVEARPDQFLSSPRVFEKLKVAIEGLIAKSPNRAELEAAVDLGLRFAHAEDAGSEGTATDLAEYAEQRERDLELLRPILATIGFDRLNSVIIGGATVSPELVYFFRAVGAPMLEAYGCTETLLNVFNLVHDFKTGTAGKALPGVELRLADDGEVLCRGPLNFSGYFKDPEKTAEAVDADGWVHTGDIGVLDEDGFLKIVDRKKEIIINSYGKNMSPAVIETAVLEECSLIAQFVAIGESRNYVTGLVAIDPEAAAGLVREHPQLAGLDLPELIGSAVVRAEVEQAVERASTRLNSNEQVKRFAIVGKAWEVDGDELTPTAKAKRRIVSSKYDTVIDRLYTQREALLRA